MPKQYPPMKIEDPKTLHMIQNLVKAHVNHADITKGQLTLWIKGREWTICYSTGVRITIYVPDERR